MTTTNEKQGTSKYELGILQSKVRSQRTKRKYKKSAAICCGLDHREILLGKLMLKGVFGYLWSPMYFVWNHLSIVVGVLYLFFYEKAGSFFGTQMIPAEHTELSWGTYFVLFFFSIGALMSSFLLREPLSYLWEYLTRPNYEKQNFPEQFGKWAIVTGCTSGSGEQFVRELARKNMNILMISRTESKLIELKRELKNEFQHLEIDYIAYDFNLAVSEKPYLEESDFAFGEDAGLDSESDSDSDTDCGPKYDPESGISNTESESFFRMSSRKFSNMLDVIKETSHLDVDKDFSSPVKNSSKDCSALKSVFSQHMTEKEFFRDKIVEKLDAIHASGSTIGILVNNAGSNINIPEYTEKVDDEDWMSVIITNIIGTVQLTKLVIPYLKKQGKGGIIFVSSGSSTHPTPLMTYYTSTKAFINQFSLSLSHELKPFGIDVLLTLPYYMISNMYKKSKPSILVCTPLRYVKAVLPHLGRYYVSSGYSFHAFIIWLSSLDISRDRKITGECIYGLMLYNKARNEDRIKKQKQKDEEQAKLDFKSKIMSYGNGINDNESKEELVEISIVS